MLDKYTYDMDWVTKGTSFGDLSNYRKYQYKLIKNYIGNDILEVGSGDRSFTSQLLLNDINCKINKIFSIEPSEILFKYYDKCTVFHNKVKFQNVDLFDMKANEQDFFDTVLFIHVLEHIENDKKALDFVCDFIKSHGHVLIEVPAIPWLFSEHDKSLGHYRRYNKKMIRSIVDQNKYEIIKMQYNDPIGLLGSLYFFKLKKIKLKTEEGMGLVKNQGNIYDKYIIPFEAWLEKLIIFPFGLCLTVVLRKK